MIHQFTSNVQLLIHNARSIVRETDHTMLTLLDNDCLMYFDATSFTRFLTTSGRNETVRCPEEHAWQSFRCSCKANCPHCSVIIKLLCRLYYSCWHWLAIPVVVYLTVLGEKHEQRMLTATDKCHIKPGFFVHGISFLPATCLRLQTPPDQILKPIAPLSSLSSS